MLLTKSDIQGRWSKQVILDLWSSYDPDNDEPIAFWVTPQGEQLCCDCASNWDHEHGYSDKEDDSPLTDEDTFDPHIGCDHCATAIAFD